MLQVRKNFISDDNPYLFALPHSKTSLYGYKVLQKHAMKCGAENPKAITCTKLRKHLAMLCQLLNMNASDMEQLTKFMGHTMGVHYNSYRLPDGTYQTAKVSKLLLLMEKGEAGKYKGKSLDDIELDLKEALQSDNEDDSVDDEGELVISTPTQEPMPHIEAKKHKRILVPWTEEQKSVVTSYFKYQIKKKIAPKKGECEKIIAMHPEVLHNKSWLKIKVFVQNMYSKRLKCSKTIVNT